MPTEVILPKVDMDMATGKIARWYAVEGASVTKGEPLFEIETDKAAMEVEAPASGVLRHVTGVEGVDIPVGQAVAWIYAPGEAESAAPRSAPAQADANSPGAEATLAPQITQDETAAPAAGDSAAGVRATPLARRLAREAHVDIASLTGSGPHGRVQAQDIAGAASPPDAETPRGTAEGAAWVRQAAGDVPVVLIHGFGSESASWRPLLTAFTRQVPIVALDLPGHGAAAQLTAEGFDDLVAHVERTLEALGVQAAHLVGHSLGAAVAAAVAAGVGVEARSLMLIAPAGLGPEINTAFTESFAAARELDDLRAAMAPLVADPRALSDGLLRATQRTRADGRLAAAQTRLGARLFADGRQQFSVRQLIGDLAVPVKVVTGGADRVIPSPVGLPGHVGVHRFEHLGHMPQLEAREAVAKLLDELVRSS